MNEDRRPANGEPAADTSPSADEAPGGGPAPEASRPASGPGDGAEPSEAGGGAEDPAHPEAGGGEPPVPGPENERGPEPGDGSRREAGDERGEAAAREPGEAEETVESLRARLDEALDEVRRERDAALRARAETENVRRRAERDVERAHRFGVEGLVGELLPVRDGLELGIRASGEEGSTVEALAEGTEMTLRMLSAALEKFGAVEVDPAGEDFDPRFHEAMTMREADGVEPGKVLQVFQKGCLLHGRVVRPAKVVVSR